jgi:hypothetical protein
MYFVSLHKIQLSKSILIGNGRQILIGPSVHLANDPFAAQTGRSLSPAVWRHSKNSEILLRTPYYHKLQFYFPNSLASCTEFANRCSTVQRCMYVRYQLGMRGTNLDSVRGNIEYRVPINKQQVPGRRKYQVLT